MDATGGQPGRAGAPQATARTPPTPPPPPTRRGAAGNASHWSPVTGAPPTPPPLDEETEEYERVDDDDEGAGVGDGDDDDAIGSIREVAIRSQRQRSPPRQVCGPSPRDSGRGTRRESEAPPEYDTCGGRCSSMIFGVCRDELNLYQHRCPGLCGRPLVHPWYCCCESCRPYEEGSRNVEPGWYTDEEEYE